MNLEITNYILTTLFTFGGAVIVYLVNRVNTLEKKIEKLTAENDRLEGMISGLLTGFVSIYAKSNDQSLSSEILELVKETQKTLREIKS